MFDFVFGRRIGRVGFLAGFLLTMVAVLPWLVPLEEKEFLSTSEAAMFIAGIVALVFSNLVLSAWRCHDFGKSGWHDFWTNELPFIGGFVSIYEMLFKPGDPHWNAWGPPPRF
jgi:uncharacterized membrane protein YhaH (DUF805 family)